MSASTQNFSDGFSRLYCDATVIESFSRLHPVSFRRVLPFQSGEKVIDDRRLIEAEAAHLANGNDATRREVVDEYSRCGLLARADASELRSVLDFFDADFFELMGLVYANAGMFRCALRWQRELIHRLETQNSNSRSDEASVYADVGYCLYSLGLFEEAISWSRSCIGPRVMADAICRALIACKTQSVGGVIRGIERSGPRTRYTVSSSDAAKVRESVFPILNTMKIVAPFADIYIDSIGGEAAMPGVEPGGHPFRSELDGGSLIRHKMNLLFASCGRADALLAEGCVPEAKRLLLEAAMLEPEGDMIQARLDALR
jgi:hypothetical protein